MTTYLGLIRAQHGLVADFLEAPAPRPPGRRQKQILPYVPSPRPTRREVGPLRPLHPDSRVDLR